MQFPLVVGVDGRSLENQPKCGAVCTWITDRTGNITRAEHSSGGERGEIFLVENIFGPERNQQFA
jgi:hypothetical protein